MFKNWFSSKKEEITKPKGKWDITIEEGLQQYGSASALLDAIAEDYQFPKECWMDPRVELLMMERKERLNAKRD
jgi:hypothetical protein